MVAYKDRVRTRYRQIRADFMSQQRNSCWLLTGKLKSDRWKLYMCDCTHKWGNDSVESVIEDEACVTTRREEGPAGVGGKVVGENVPTGLTAGTTAQSDLEKKSSRSEQVVTAAATEPPDRTRRRGWRSGGGKRVLFHADDGLISF